MNKRSAQEHKLRGTYQRSRHGKRASIAPVPPVTDPPAPPAHLQGEARAFWQELAPLLHKAKRLTALDLPRLELLAIHLAAHRHLYARLTAVLAKQGAGVAVDTSRIMRALRQQANTVRALSVGFGLDPADRERLPIVPAQGTNPWSKFGDPPVSKWSGVLP